MFRLGFPAACVSRPYPWRDGLPPLSAADGWFPAEMTAGGLPVLPRYHLGKPREDLVFRALLGQPLILYGHHWDLAAGLDPLADAATDVNALGDVRWLALDAIAERCFATAQTGALLRVRLFSRDALIAVPAGVSELQVTVPVLHGEPAWGPVELGDARAALRPEGAGWSSQVLPVGDASNVWLRLEAREPLRPELVGPPRVRVWPAVRRLLVECRDRARPLRP
jgi:hypothetical protein